MQPIVDGRFRKALDLLKWFSIAALAGAVTSTCQAQLLYTGVNLAGADFGPTPTPGNTGTFGTDYTYPTDQEINYFLSEGMNTIRLPFRWERLQPTPDAPFNSAELRA